MASKEDVIHRGQGKANFEFLNELTKEQRSDLSKAVRDMVTSGRILLAAE
jgi:hypothetical protein